MTTSGPRARGRSERVHTTGASGLKTMLPVVGVLAALFVVPTPSGGAGQLPDRLIDMHVHAWQEPPRSNAFKQSLLNGFAAFHLERAVVSGPEEAAVAAAALAPGKLLIGLADGAGSHLPSSADLETLVQRQRIAVLGELDGAWDGEPLTATRLERYFTLAENSGMPVAIFTGMAPPGTVERYPNYRAQLGQPSAIEPVLARHPRLRVYLMQAGWPFLEDTIAFMHAHPDVYADIGNLSANPAIARDRFHAYLRALMRAGLGKRVMFGSGLDLTDWAAGIGAMVSAIEDAPFLSPSDRTDIFFANAARFLDLAGHPKPGGGRD